MIHIRRVDGVRRIIGSRFRKTSGKCIFVSNRSSFIHNAYLLLFIAGMADRQGCQPPSPLLSLRRDRFARTHCSTLSLDICRASAACISSSLSPHHIRSRHIDIMQENRAEISYPRCGLRQIGLLPDGTLLYRPAMVRTIIDAVQINIAIRQRPVHPFAG